MLLTAMKNFPIGRFNPIRVLSLRTVMVCAMVLSPLAVQSQINDRDGLWQGTVACGPQQSASGRSPKAFSNPLALNVSFAALSGKRENAQVLERFVGSIDRNGHVTLDGSGQWNDNPARAWRYRLQGTQSGSQMTLAGPMESPDGKTRIRDCRVELRNLAMVKKAQAASSKPAPVSPPLAATPVPAAPAAPVVPAAPSPEPKNAPIKARSAMDL